MVLCVVFDAVICLSVYCMICCLLLIVVVYKFLVGGLVCGLFATWLFVYAVLLMNLLVLIMFYFVVMFVFVV